MPTGAERWLVVMGFGLAGAPLGLVAGAAAARLARPTPTAPRPVTASLGMVLIAWAAVSGAPPESLAVSALLATALLALACVDVAVFRLPDVVTLPLIGAGLGLAAATGQDVRARLIGAMLGYGAIALLAAGFRRLRGRDGIGMGDAKLLAAAGAWLGWRALPWTVLLACGFAFLWVAVLTLRQGRARLSGAIAFGAPLALAFWIVRLYGAPSG